jgi:hypothetical protein
MLFATSLHKRISYKSIKIYLAAIQYTTTIMGVSIRLTEMHRLYYTLLGIRRLQGSTFSRPPRSPFTLSLMNRFHSRLHIYHSYQDTQMLKAASLIAFFGLLRASEYLTSNSNYFTNDTLLVTDIQFANNFNYVTIHIKQSKTDPFRQGCYIKVWANHGSSCPVRNLRIYLLQNNHIGPLFQFNNRSYLTRATFSKIIQLCLPNTNLNTHSFRIGGASAAHEAGVPDTTIQTLGRWASNAFRLYLRIPDNTIQEAQHKMSCIKQSKPWYPREEQREGGDQD